MPQQPNAYLLALALCLSLSGALAEEPNSASVVNPMSAAASALQQKVNAGDADAMNALGNLFLDGEGVPQSSTEAVRLFKKSVELGNADGAMNLGRAYFRGRGIQFDQSESIKWFKIESGLRAGKSVDLASSDAKPKSVNTFPVGITPLTCSVQVPPEMPKAALQTGKGGRVKAQVMIVGGKIRDVSILSGPRTFQDQVISALFKYQCNPNSVDGFASQEFSFYISDEVN